MTSTNNKFCIHCVAECCKNTISQHCGYPDCKCHQTPSSDVGKCNCGQDLKKGVVHFSKDFTPTPNTNDEEWEGFCAEVWEALKGDHNDLRRQQVILNAAKSNRAALVARILEEFPQCSHENEAYYECPCRNEIRAQIQSHL